MKVSIFGDSHSQYYGLTPQLRNMHPILKNIKENLSVIKGATVIGMGRNRSSLNTMNLIKKVIANDHPDIVVLNFGQVDIELGYYYRLVVKGEDIKFSSFVSMLCESYATAIKDNFSDFRGRIIIKGINVSVLSFFNQKKIVYTRRIIFENKEFSESETSQMEDKLKSIMPSDDDRYYMHIYFNAILKKMCDDIGILYYDINDEICDRQNLCVRPELIPARSDHHLLDSLAVRWMYWRGVLNLINPSDL